MNYNNGKKAEELMRKMDKRIERQEKIGSFFMGVVSTPLCILFRTIAFIAKIVGIIASFVLCYALYKGYILFTERDLMETAEIMSEVFSIAKMVATPFIAFFVSGISDKLQEYFYLNSIL